MSEEFSKLTPITHCPICGRELERGYMMSTYGIHWDTKKHKFHTVTVKETIAPTPTFTMKNLPTLRCSQCKVVISYYGNSKKKE